MPNAMPGMKVRVNLGGLNAPGVSMGGGVSSSGTIAAIDALAGQITVDLDIAINGQNRVVVSPDRVTAM